MDDGVLRLILQAVDTILRKASGQVCRQIICDRGTPYSLLRQNKSDLFLKYKLYVLRL